MYLSSAHKLGPSPPRLAAKLPAQVQHQQHQRVLPSFQHRCPHHRAFQLTTASQRFFDIRIQSSWGGGPNISQSTEAVGSRWWSAGNQDSEQEAEQQQSSSSTDRWSNLFSTNRDTGSASYSTSSNGSGSSYGDGGSYAPSYGSQNASDGSSSTTSPGSLLAGNAAPWVIVALIPTLLWCITWCLTGGMVTLANTSMSGMCSMARLLFPSLPVKGVGYEDVAVSLVKALHSGTDLPSTWTRPGLLAPAWLLRSLMATMFNLATGSASIAAALIPSQQWLLVSGVSQGLMYATCLLLMLPLGAGISSLAQQASKLVRWYQARQPSQPSKGWTFSLPRLTDNTALALKLAGVLAWPCISTAAVLQPSVMAQNNFTANFTVATLQVAACSMLLLLLLAVALTAGRFAAELGQHRGSSEAVLNFGYQVGLLCAVAGLMNVAQIGLGLASGLLGPPQLVLPVISTLILGRVVWSIWRLHRIGSATPSIWLQLLTIAPGLQLPGTNSSS